jgi:hypothetical protein
MFKILVVAIFAALPLLFSAGQVNAGIKSGTMVSCPVRTCGGGGGPNAKDAKYCKASNCGKGKSGAR